MSTELILTVLAFAMFTAFVCTIASEADRKNNKDSENLKKERDHKKLAGKEED